MNRSTSGRRVKWRLPDDGWVAVGLITAAIVWEIAGRSIFAVWDINNQAYGARYWAETGAPWMTVWMGIDLIIGLTSKLTNDPELAITILGCFFNVLASIAMFAISRQTGINRFLSGIIGLLTATWFLPHLGGCIGGNISFLFGLSPALIYALNSNKWSITNSFLLGITFAIGLTLKLNAFAPAFAVALTWLLARLITKTIRQDPNILQRNFKQFRVHLAAGVSAIILTAVIIEGLIQLDGGVYPTILQTYLRVRDSLANNQISVNRMMLLPLGVDLKEALEKNQLGVLIFSPAIIGFWGAMTWSIKQRFSKHAPIDHLRHEVAIVIMLASALTCVGLGRGLTHRMLLLPAGILISFADLPIQAKHLKATYSCALAAAISSWMIFGWIQKNVDISSIYDSRALTKTNKQTYFCIGGGPANGLQNFSTHVIHAKSVKQTGAIHESKGMNRCWERDEWKDSFAGLADVQEIANGMNSVYKNETPGKSIFREKWNSLQATPEGREAWLNQEINAINQHQMPFLIERLTLSNAELETPGYKEWGEGRRLLRQELTKRLNAKEVGRIGLITIWETQWHQEEIPKQPIPAQ